MLVLLCDYYLQLASLPLQQQGNTMTTTITGNADSDSDTEDTASSTTGGASTLTYGVAGAAGSVAAGSTARQASRLTAGGTSPRVIMRIALEMKQLQLVLPYETGTAPLLSGSMDGFSLLIDTTSEGMDITTSLGNLVAECGVRILYMYK